MPISLAEGRSSMCIRKPAFEQFNFTRAGLDAKWQLTPDEFRMEGNLIVVGPAASDETIGNWVADLEAEGLTYYDDFFEFSGNWPGWLDLFVKENRPARSFPSP